MINEADPAYRIHVALYIIYLDNVGQPYLVISRVTRQSKTGRLKDCPGHAPYVMVDECQVSHLCSDLFAGKPTSKMYGTFEYASFLSCTAL